MQSYIIVLIILILACCYFICRSPRNRETFVGDYYDWAWDEHMIPLQNMIQNRSSCPAKLANNEKYITDRNLCMFSMSCQFGDDSIEGCHRSFDVPKSKSYMHNKLTTGSY